MLQKEKLLPILVSRTVLFFFIMCLFTVFLYVAGTVQGFVDSTQFGLLRLYIVLGLFLAAVSACGMFLDLGRLFKQKKMRYLPRAAGYLLLTLFALATVLATLFIITISDGNVL